MWDETGIFEDPEIEFPDASEINHDSVCATRLNLERVSKDMTGLTADLLQTPCSSYANPGGEVKFIDTLKASAIVDSGYCNSISSAQSEIGDSVKYKHSFDVQRKQFVVRDDTNSRDEDLPCPKVRLLSAFDETPSSIERKIAGTKFGVSHAQFSRSIRSSHRRSLDSYFDADLKKASSASRQPSSAHIDLFNLPSASSDVPTSCSFYTRRKGYDTFIRRHSVSDVSSLDFTADKILHSTPVLTFGLSRRNAESNRMYTFISPKKYTVSIEDSRLIDSKGDSLSTYDPSLDSIVALKGSDTRYRVRDGEADLKLYSFTSSSAKNECNLTVDQQKELESVLDLFSPPVRDRVIGRKMGLVSVDFIEEFHVRSMTEVLKIILGNVDIGDLIQMSSISGSWTAAVDNDLASQQRIKLWKTRTINSPNQKSASKENSNDGRKCAKKNLMTGANQPLSLIQSKNTVSPAATKKENCTVDLFLEEASKLKTGESLTKCSRCQRPARRDPAQERARCTSELCRFDYCTKCLRDFHGAERCDVGQSFRSDLKIGSKQSRKNLRRLL